MSTEQMPAPQGVAEVMEQAQVFASAWALIGGRFDRGTAVDLAKDAEAELRAMVLAIVQERDVLKACVAELEGDEAMRAAFEAWCDDFGIGYEENCFQAFKAATLAERERCAKVCDQQAARESYSHAKHAVGACADAIRKGEPS